MKFTELKIKTQRQSSKESESANAELLTRGAYIDQVMAGAYTYLPLGLRVIKKIENIIREEMDNIGGLEILMPALHPAENWKVTGRWDTLDDLFRFKSYYTKNNYALGATHEEVVTPLAHKYIQSYKDLPTYLYQIQNKFRDEKRAKAGLLRGRDFIMKDLYSFHADQKDLDRYYEKVKNAYVNIYNRVGIGGKTYLTFASGGSFAKYSHEFQTESDSGEDLIYLCKKCNIAINKEIIKDQNSCPICKRKDFTEIKSIEVGNIFKLGTKYSTPFNLTYVDELNKQCPVIMGCYGIGIGRLMGAVTEVSHDDKGIVWPISIAPFTVILVSIGGDREIEISNKIYEDLVKRGIEVIYDDRDETAGSKLADADLLGIPIRVVVSKKTLDNDSVEIKLRHENKAELVRLDEFTAVLWEKINAK